MTRILVVDDNVDSAWSLGILLQEAGYAIDLAKDGGEAMLKIGLAKPDVVILDLMMPDINGWEFLDSQSKSQAKDIPVIVYSGWTHTQQPLTDNIVAVLEKPVGVDQILTALKGIGK